MKPSLLHKFTDIITLIYRMTTNLGQICLRYAEIFNIDFAGNVLPKVKEL